jgi:hypothetical protein
MDDGSVSVHTKAETTTHSLPDRRGNVAGAIASFRMEGLEPDAVTAGILELYVAGRLTLEEMGAAIEDHVKQMNAGKAISGAA